MKNALVGIAALAVLAAPATAADLAVKMPSPRTAQISSWTGLYAGLNVGGAWGHRDISFAPNDPATAGLFAAGAAPPPTSFNTRGGVGGLQLGYNWQVDRSWVVGAEADFDWSGIRGSSLNSFLWQSQGALLGSPMAERIPWFGTVRARLGYLPSDTLLTYLTGGFAYAQVEHNASYGSPFGFTDTAVPFSANCIAGAACFAGTPGKIALGWSAGGGLEYAVSRQFTLKAEYLYLNLNSQSVVESAVSTFSFAPIPASLTASYSRTTLNVVRAGANWHF